MEPYHYGLYLNETEQWEALIMGKDLSKETKDEILTSFLNNKGQDRDKITQNKCRRVCQ